MMFPTKHKQAGDKFINWWAAVWRGLVVDSQAKHYAQMRTAIWLYIYLVIHADRKSGQLIRRYRTIASDMGVKEATVRYWMNRLRCYDYIATEHTGRALVILIRKWKSWGSR